MYLSLRDTLFFSLIESKYLELTGPVKWKINYFLQRKTRFYTVRYFNVTANDVNHVIQNTCWYYSMAQWYRRTSIKRIHVYVSILNKWFELTCFYNIYSIPVVNSPLVTEQRFRYHITVGYLYTDTCPLLIQILEIWLRIIIRF